MIYTKKILITLVLIVVFGCSNDLTLESDQVKDTGPRSIAQNFLLSGKVQSTDKQWGTNGEVTQLYPIYIDGVEEPSYYECKVVNNGNDAGYILVNTNDTDVKVPEYTTNGRTFTEKFREELNTTEFKVYRYSNLQYIVFSNDSRNNANILTSTGFQTGVQINKAREEMINNVTTFGSAIGIDKDIIEESNHDDEFTNSRAHNEWFTTLLKNAYNYNKHDPDSSDRLPLWSYYSSYWSDVPHYEHINEITLAFGKVYAYWARYKGKTKLLDGGSTTGGIKQFITNNETHRELLELKGDIKSTSGGRSLEDEVVKYPNRKGYSFECDVDYGNAWDKGNKAYNSIANDRPVVIELKTGFTAVEGISKKYRVRGKRKKRYYHREMWYRINPTGMNNDNGAYWVCSYARYGQDEGDDVNVDGVYHIWD